MAKAAGVKVEQYDRANNLIASYNSISEASRHSGITKSTIQNYLKNGTSDRSEFIWKKAA
jgi:DNA invertase Pin-like site-specific DNA recombinase